MSDSENIAEQPGIEPGTFRLLVGCSTNWAIESDGEEHWFNYLLGLQLQFLSSNIF